MVAHGEWFDERRFVQGDVADRVDPASFDDDFFSEAAAPPGQADKVHVRGQVVVRSRLGGFLGVDDVRLDDHIVTDLEVGDVLADGVDGAGHFMAKGDGC